MMCTESTSENVKNLQCYRLKRHQRTIYGWDDELEELAFDGEVCDDKPWILLLLPFRLIVPDDSGRLAPAKLGCGSSSYFMCLK
jgi:hypothetical protein